MPLPATRRTDGRKLNKPFVPPLVLFPHAFIRSSRPPPHRSRACGRHVRVQMPFTGNYCFMASLCTFAGSQKKKKSLQTGLKEQTNHVQQSVMLTLTIKLLTKRHLRQTWPRQNPCENSEQIHVEKLRSGDLSAAK